MIQNWSQLLPAPDRNAFLGACAEAGPDVERLQPVLDRYFSTWKTSLIADDLRRLQALAADAQIREHVKVVCIEDEFVNASEFEGITLSESSVLWPRQQNGDIVPGELGTDSLRSMFAAKHLRPTKLEIKDKRNWDVDNNPDNAASLARDILDGADLAMTSFSLRAESSHITIVAAELSPAHQGHNMGFSLLKKAELICRETFQSYWANQLLYHAPALEELSLSFWRPSIMRTPETPPVLDSALPKLKKLELFSGGLSARNILAILSNSKQSLTGISVRLFTLLGNATWAELLSRICDEFPHLAWFKLTSIGEHSTSGRRVVAFPGLDKDSVVGEPHRNMLKLLKRGPADNQRISGVEYDGPNAPDVLRIVARCILRYENGKYPLQS
ncbi:hypothetical protein GGR57DRAFT_488129 [Xylariaceae sp. FL1272]|nr:hypothetical protein GGR57DRAFT_488129 [Xylariaceae sp. FL1272]